MTPDMARPGILRRHRDHIFMVALLLAYVVCHVLLEMLGNRIYQEKTVSLWYPVAGLTSGVIVYYGARGALIAFCGICISHMLTGDPRISFFYILPYAFAITGMILLWRSIFVRTGILAMQLAQTPRWAVGLMFFAALASLSNAILGELLLYASGIVAWNDIPKSIVAFYFGDLIGMMSIAPFVCLAIFPALTRIYRGSPPRPWRWKSAMLIYSALSVIGFFIIINTKEEHNLMIAYLGSLPILIAAVRGHVRETCLAICFLTFAFIFGLAYIGQFQTRELAAFMILMMAVAYVVTTAISTNRAVTRSLASTLEERDRLANTQQKLNDQMTRLRSMEALGTLAGGMAHELNNMLQPILTFSKAAETAAEADRKTYLDRIRECTLSAKTLVQDVLTFARSGNNAGALDSVQTHVADIVFCNSISLARKALPSTIVIKEHHAVDGATIVCVPVQLVQILINLFRNAADAKARTLTLRSFLQEDRVILLVEDDGLGMDVETATRALEPFFTTKEIGRGTGLGLSVVYGLITSWGGDLRIDSAPGRGTIMQLDFPMQPAETRHGDHIAG
jgi:signal transduction histidine kinase